MMLPIHNSKTKTKTSRKKFERHNIKAFLNYGAFTEMIAVVDGDRKWFCVKMPYKKVKELVGDDVFEKVNLV